MRLESYLNGLAEKAIAATSNEAAPGLVRPTQDERYGDYQVNGVLPLAKRLGQAPRQVAVPVAEWLGDQPAIASAEVAGPGFINLRLSQGWMAEQLVAMLADVPRLGVPHTDTPLKTVVDFSAPNIAKQMHVGHLRSTILGDCLVRLLRFVGHEVIGDNHLGDWGTQYGLLLLGLQRWSDAQAMQREPLVELERIYRLATATAREDEAFAAQARQELAKLHGGDAENLRRWQAMVDVSKQALQQAYDRLGVRFDLWRGESAYHEMLPDVVQRLLDAGIAHLDEEAVCVFFADLGQAPQALRELKTPLIVRKRDGAFLYATTDIATGLYRRDVLAAEQVICVVDVRQSLHFQQVFAVLRALGVEMRLEHVGFGTILGTDGKPWRTRDGGTVSLQALLDEAEERALRRIGDQALQVPEEQRAATAKAVGIGAVKYADLRQHRLTDYRFDWDKMLSFQGNSGPYLQYAYARIGSLLRRAAVEPSHFPLRQPLALDETCERSLAKHLLRFADTVHAACDGLQPHLLCEHLYQLARCYSAFYEACPVLQASSEELRQSRLALSILTARQLACGLNLLGIDVVEQM